MARETELSAARRDFADPPARFRPAPFWFWNDARPGILTAEAIRSQVLEMRDGGLGGFMIFNKPPGGFSAGEFLGERWFGACRAALDAAREAGMRAWVNDDFDFPPGGIAGRMKTLVPDAFHRDLACSIRTVSGPGKRCISPRGGELLSVMASRAGGRSLDALVDVMQEAGRSAEGLVWKAPRGTWDLHVVTERTIQWELRPGRHHSLYPSLLDPEVADAFMANTYELYAKELSAYFGDPLVGFFSDADARSLHPFPWARGFSARFRDRFGYDLRPVLPSLWQDIGPPGRAARRDYFHFLSLSYAGWFSRIHEWCRARGLLYTYHTSDTGPFTRDPRHATCCRRSSFFSEGRYHEVNAHADYPGTDHELLALAGNLHFTLRLDGRREDVTPKTVTWGVGPVHGACRRVLVRNKTFGDVRAKYASSVAHLRGCRGAQVEAFAAVNWGATLEGRRKEFAPPSHFRGSHLWQRYRAFSDGSHVADVAVLDPAMSAWECEKYRCDAFLRALDCLNHSPYGYDVVDEDSLGAARTGRDAQGAYLSAAPERYRAIVLPGITSLDPATAGRLQGFADRGVPLVCVGALPAGLPAKGVHVIRRLSYSNEEIPERTALHRALGSLIEPDFLAQGIDGSSAAGVHFLHVRSERHHAYFISNLEGEGGETVHDLSFRVPAWAPELWNPSTGGASELPGERTRGCTALRLPLGPRQSALVVFSKGQAPMRTRSRAARSHSPQSPPKLTPLLTLDRWRIQPLDHNVLPLSLWHSPAGAAVAWSRIPGDCREIRSAFTVRDPLSCLDLLLPDNTSGWQCRVNGVSLDPARSSRRTLLDEGYARHDISALARVGDNEVSLAPLAHGHFDAPWSPPRLSGEFVVRIAPATSGGKFPTATGTIFAASFPRKRASSCLHSTRGVEIRLPWDPGPIRGSPSTPASCATPRKSAWRNHNSPDLCTLTSSGCAVPWRGA